MEIPGFYYDQEKRRYFKIANGSSCHSYHNSAIQAKKRRLQHEKKNDRSSTGGIRNNKRQLLRSFLSLRNRNDALGYTEMRLSLVQLNESLYWFHKYKSIQYECTINLDCDFLVGIVGARYLLVAQKDSLRMRLVSVDNILNKSCTPSSAYNEDIRIFQFIQELRLQGSNCTIPKMKILAASSSYLFSSISLYSSRVEDVENESPISLFKLKKWSSGGNLIDLTSGLLFFIHKLEDEKIKSELIPLLKLQYVVLDWNTFTYQYAYSETKSKTCISCAHIDNHFLFLGTNFGAGYKFALDEFDGSIRSCKRFFTFPQYEIQKIVSYDDNVFISGKDRRLLILGDSLKKIKVLKHSEKITDFGFCGAQRVVISSLRSVKIYNYKSQSADPISINYFNDNTAYQICMFDPNVFFISQSSDELLLVNCHNYHSEKVRLRCLGGHLVNFCKLTDNHFIFQWDSSQPFHLYCV